MKSLSSSLKPISFFRKWDKKNLFHKYHRKVNWKPKTKFFQDLNWIPKQVESIALIPDPRAWSDWTAVSYIYIFVYAKARLSRLAPRNITSRSVQNFYKLWNLRYDIMLRHCIAFGFYEPWFVRRLLRPLVLRADCCGLTWNSLSLSNKDLE